jgi:hypothetical protein
MKTTLTAMLMMAVAATAGAQVIVHEAQSKAATEQHLQLLLEKAPSTGVHLSVETRPVTGAPYTGEAVTESVNVLADGNRIVRRTSVRVYRDSAGRTRRETMGPDGQVTSITISNPSTGVSYMLQPETNTARRSMVVTSTFVPSGGAGLDHVSSTGAIAVYVSPDGRHETEARVIRDTEPKAHVTTGQVQVATGQVHVTTGQAGVTTVGPITWVTEGAGTGSPASSEDLGQQTIEGVLAKGSRSTTVIPAGAIGNEQPITVVSEEWFSQDLKVLVLTKHVDPRVGETTYRLTRIGRSEPDPTLFELPAGYTVK